MTRVSCSLLLGIVWVASAEIDKLDFASLVKNALDDVTGDAEEKRKSKGIWERMFQKTEGGETVSEGETESVGIEKSYLDKYNTTTFLKAAVSNQDREEGERISMACIPASAQAEWVRSFDASVKMMLAKTKRGILDGLRGISKSLIDLLDATSCGSLKSLASFRAAALRLDVLATGKSFFGTGSKVEYVPLKSLKIGGVETTRQINDVILAWEMRTDSQAVGKRMQQFLAIFRDEETEDDRKEDATVEANAETFASSGETTQNPRFTTSYWAAFIEGMFAEFGPWGTSKSLENCVTDHDARKLGTIIDYGMTAAQSAEMHHVEWGLREASSRVHLLVEHAVGTCDSLSQAPFMRRYMSNMDRVKVYLQSHMERRASATQTGANVVDRGLVEIGGIDITEPMGVLIKGWTDSASPQTVGKYFAKFMQSFEADTTTQDDQASGDLSKEENPLVKMLRDALLHASGNTVKEEQIPRGCLPSDEVIAEWEAGMSDGTETMLQRRKKTMQQALRKWADASENLFSKFPYGGRHCSSVQRNIITMRVGAQKLGKISRGKIVDYGKYIQYEALKTLVVGGVPIMEEVNGFIGLWHLGNKGASGAKFAQLFMKFKDIKGRDEL